MQKKKIIKKSHIPFTCDLYQRRWFYSLEITYLTPHGTVEWQVNTLVSDYKLQRIDNVTNITILVHQLDVND